MKQFFQKISAVLMAFVVMFSTMSFTISEHFCGDLLVDSAIFSKAESCGMELEKPSPNKDCSSLKKDCCSDILKQIKGQDELQFDFISLDFNQQVFVTAFTYSYLNLFEGFDINIKSFKNYSSPLVDKDITVLYRVFRI